MKIGFQFSSNFVIELILGRRGFELYMNNFRQISTELLPLIYVENWFLCSILGNFWLIIFKLCILVDNGEECFVIIDG